MRKIYVAGHLGMVGSAICRKIQLLEDVQLITRSRLELDLCDQKAVNEFMSKVLPDEVILAASRVGGILANNNFPADFIYENLQIQNNVINSAHIYGVQKLLFLGSSCIYPKNAKQPMYEDALLTGPLEPTNEPYAIAKIAGIKLCESYNRQYGRDYRSVMPTNLYGAGDNYHLENSHVVPALIRRFHEAKVNGSETVTVWGNGKSLREFLYVDDMAQASLFVHFLDKADYYSSVNPMLSHVNVGTGEDISIKDLATAIKKVVGFGGRIIFDDSKPNGAPRKLMNVDLLSQIGWQAQTSLVDGLIKTYDDYQLNKTRLRS